MARWGDLHQGCKSTGSGNGLTSNTVLDPGEVALGEEDTLTCPPGVDLLAGLSITGRNSETLEAVGGGD